MNGVNLNLFQFEFDLTWMAFFMDAHDRFYARYGGREDSDAESHLTKESLARVMEQVLELHQKGKVQTSTHEPRGGTVQTPEDIPPMKAMMARRKESKCIHCHDVKVARLRHLQQLGKFTRDLVFTYPTPSALGIRVDRNVQNKVASVVPGSSADRAGVRTGDRLLAADGQRILTLGDFSRLLEQKPQEGKLALEIRRGRRAVRATLQLSGDWRKSADPSWRESLHVAGPGGGFWGVKLTGDQRRERGIPADALALRVTFIWGAHTRRAGLKVDDVVVELDGIRRDMTVRQIHAYLQLGKNYGDTVPLVVRRRAEQHKLSMRLPAEAPKLE